MTQTNQQLTVSIIVPCRNEAGAVGRFLDSLTRQDLDAYDWEIIIADGMSEDGTRELLSDFERRNRRIRIIDNVEKITPTGLNRAILASKGEIILRMDVHTEYASEYVRTCVETLLSTKADNVGGPARTRAEGLLPKAVAAAYHSPFACGGARFHNEDYEGFVDTVPYGCWKKTTLDRLGLFDEELVRNQDDELNLRLVRSGGSIWQSPAIMSWYSPRSSLRSLFKQYYQYGFWKIPVLLRHRVPASWRHLVPGSFVLADILLPLVAIAALLCGQSRLAQVSLMLLAFVIGAYTLCVAAFSMLTARRRGWALLPYLPIVFATYHFSYGLGCLTAVAYTVAQKFAPVRLGKAFTQISR